MTTLRRALTVPIVTLIEVLLLLTGPLWLVIAALMAIGTRSSRPVRTVALVLAYAVIELRLLRRILGGEPDWDALLPEVLDSAYRTMRRILDVRVVLEDGSATAERLATGNPIVVLARHCGPGDSLFIAWLLSVRYQFRLSVVLKSLLRLEPAVDLAGDHLPLCFVGHRGARSRDRVKDLAGTMLGGDALLLFPEGGNFSWPRWHLALTRLAATGAYAALRRARRRTHTLPPHRGGAFAALAGAPTADVLLLAHTGFAPDGRNRPWWRLPVHRCLEMRTTLVPGATVPRSAEELPGWLENAWSQVDTWVSDHTVDDPEADAIAEDPTKKPGT